MKKLISSIIILVFFNLLNANVGNELKFQQISPPGGYCIEGINFLIQDNYGFMWFGAKDGVFKYNSKNIRQIEILSAKSQSIKNYFCTGLVSDKNGDLWLSTLTGLFLYDRENDVFRYYNYDNYDNNKGTPPAISNINIDKDGNLWLIDNNGLFKMDYINKTIHRISIKFLKGIPSNIYFDSNSGIWLGTITGDLYKLNSNTYIAQLFCKSPGSAITAFLAYNKTIRIGYRHHGLYLYSDSGQQLKHYSYSIKPGLNLENSPIRAIYKDQNNNIWIGSYNGLFLEKNNTLTRFDSYTNSGLPHNSIYSVFQDKNEGLWFGTWSGGVSYLHPAYNKFENFRHSEEPYSLSNNFVTSFTEQNKYLYIGTGVGGLNEYNKITNHFRKISLTLNSKDINSIKSLATDKFGGLWIGTFEDGLWYRKNNESKFTHFFQGPEDGFHISGQNVNSILCTDAGVWIATFEHGVNFFDFKSGKILHLKSTLLNDQVNAIEIRNILLDSHNNLWICGKNGLAKISLINNTEIYNVEFKNYNLYYAYEILNGEIWFGTQKNGVLIYSPKSNEYSNFDAQGLLRNKDVYGIIEDADKNIWITSNNGLIRYNMDLKLVSHFLEEDGIQGNIFSHHAIFKDANQRLYFGGTNGFSIISPSTIEKNNNLPEVMIDNITVNNEKVIYHLDLDSNKTAQLHLTSKESSLKIDFAADNYLISEKNKFKYRLLPISDVWIDLGNEGTAIFSNLEGGDYTFEVIAANNDGLWNLTPLRIIIKKDYPWYKTNIALVAYLILFALIFYITLYVITERRKLKEEVNTEKIKREKEEELHQLKLKFFTNISHEFRTPLTLIASPLKKIIDSKNYEGQNKELLDIINRNTKRLLNLVNQTLNFRKMEMTENNELDLSDFDLIELVKGILDNFSEAIHEKELQIEFKHECIIEIIEADYDKIDKILFNLISNSIKYAEFKEKINISINKNSKNNIISPNQLVIGELQDDKFIRFSITNTSKIIDSKSFEKIFDRFKTINSKSKLSMGIGLSICKEYTLAHHGQLILSSDTIAGTSFNIFLPIKQSENHFTNLLHREPPHTINSISTSKDDIEINDTIKNSTILIVEDNDDLRIYIAKLLQPYFKIHQVNNGNEAIKILDLHDFDLILSDVMMPEMNGFEFCKYLKSTIQFSHIPVILLTALSTTDYKITGLEQGADAYISKPFDNTHLLIQIKNLLEQRIILKESFQKHIVIGEPFNAGNIENYFLNKIDVVIEKHIKDEDLSVQLLADNVGLSRSQLHRKLISLTNLPPSEYIKLFKLKKASELILEDRYSMDEVAFISGFSSSSYFTSSFKSVYGLTPSKWKNQKLDYSNKIKL